MKCRYIHRLLFCAWSGTSICNVLSSRLAEREKFMLGTWLLLGQVHKLPRTSLCICICGDFDLVSGWAIERVSNFDDSKYASNLSSWLLWLIFGTSHLYRKGLIRAQNTYNKSSQQLPTWSYNKKTVPKLVSCHLGRQFPSNVSRPIPTCLE